MINSARFADLSCAADAHYTGWSRAHLERVADTALLALRPFGSTGKARFRLPGPASSAGPVSDGLEAFARSFLGAAFRIGSGHDPHGFAEWYATGLAAGSDAAAVDAWPRLTDVAQARVEAAAISIGLHETRSLIWDHLDAGVQERLVEWLAGSIGTSYGDANWRWFQNVTQAFLRSVSGPHDQGEIDENLDLMNSCWLGHGWYSDGKPDGRTGNIDWYAGWVMQLFALWYGRMSGDHAPDGFLDEQKGRLAEYLPSVAQLFGRDGAPLFQGRSLTYRFAAVGALWAGPIFDVDTVAYGVIRRLGNNAVRYFVEHDAFDHHGLLSLGWHGRYEPMRQPYSGPGSPYWASLGFAGLLLDDDHELWQSPEPSIPADDHDQLAAIEPIGWLVATSAADGIVRVINHGVDHSGATPMDDDPLYTRLAYSTATAPVEGASDAGLEHVADNLVALVAPDGQLTQRRPLDLQEITAATATSRHRAHLPDSAHVSGEGSAPLLEVTSAVVDGAEIRTVTIIEADVDLTGWQLVISGYAVPAGGDLLSTVEPVQGEPEVGEWIAGQASHEHNPYGTDLVVPYLVSQAPLPGVRMAVRVNLAARISLQSRT